MIIRNESGARWLPTRIADFEKWQVGLLEESARRLDAVLDPGGHVHRYGFVGSPVTFRGQRAWLRVSPFLEHEMSRKAWRGTAEAVVIPGVSKPTLLHRIEWQGLARPSRGREQTFLGEDVTEGGAEGDSRICKEERDIPFGPAVRNSGLQAGDRGHSSLTASTA